MNRTYMQKYARFGETSVLRTRPRAHKKKSLDRHSPLPPSDTKKHVIFFSKFIIDLDTVGGVERHVVACWSASKHHGARSTEFFVAVHNHVVFKSCTCCPTWIFEKASGMYVVSNWIKSTPKTDGIVQANDLAASYRCSPDSRPSLPPPLPPLPPDRPRLAKGRHLQQLSNGRCVHARDRRFAQTILPSPAHNRALLSPRLILLAPTFFSCP